MALFHDEETEESPGKEPVRGLPQKLPPGEHILWQGRAEGRSLAIHAFHVRSIGIYFAALTAVGALIHAGQGASSDTILQYAGAMAVSGLLAIGILSLIAWGMARGSLFTITSARVVFRHGIGLRKYINIPFSDLQSVDYIERSSGVGDIAVSVAGKRPVPYIHLWPFARPLKFLKPIPLMRCIPNVSEVAATFAEAVQRAKLRSDAEMSATEALSPKVTESENIAQVPVHAETKSAAGKSLKQDVLSSAQGVPAQ